jgi:hypothetical protein
MVVKTGQLTDRAIYVYLPTVDMAQEWKSLADKARISISKFVTEHVENSLKQEQERSRYASRAELLKQIKERDDEIARLKQEVKLLKMLSENLDNELKKYRAQPFLAESSTASKFEGVREYDKELIELLKKTGHIDNDSLLKELGIRPKDLDLVKAIRKQLRNLEAYGLVSSTARGWKWLG